MSDKFLHSPTFHLKMTAKTIQPDNNIQKSTSNPFNGNMNHMNGTILYLYPDLLQPNRNTILTAPQQTGYCSVNYNYSSCLYQSKYNNKFLPEPKISQVLSRHTSFYRSVLDLSLTGGEFKDVIVCYTYLHRN